MKLIYATLMILAVCLFLKALQLFMMTLGAFCLLGAAVFALAVFVCWGKLR